MNSFISLILENIFILLNKYPEDISLLLLHIFSISDLFFFLVKTIIFKVQQILLLSFSNLDINFSNILLLSIIMTFSNLIFFISSKPCSISLHSINFTSGFNSFLYFIFSLLAIL